MSETNLVLPASVITKADLTRLLREIEQLESDLTTASVQQKLGRSPAAAPELSPQAADFLATRDDVFEQPQVRAECIKQLRALKDNAPMIHMTFASSPDRNSLQRLVDWLREKVHPQALIAVGLQPELIGGVHVRTTNHMHDMSLRAQLAGHRDVITQELEAIRAGR